MLGPALFHATRKTGEHNLGRSVARQRAIVSMHTASAIIALSPRSHFFFFFRFFLFFQLGQPYEFEV